MSLLKLIFLTKLENLEQIFDCLVCIFRNKLTLLLHIAFLFNESWSLMVSRLAYLVLELNENSKGYRKFNASKKKGRVEKQQGRSSTVFRFNQPISSIRPCRVVVHCNVDVNTTLRGQTFRYWGLT